jgi:hypothetical protein
MRVSSEEIAAGKLSAEALAAAARELQDAGFVTLEGVVAREQIDRVREAYEAAFERYRRQPEVQARIDGGHAYIGMHVPFEPPFSDPLICANPLAVQVMQAAMGEDIVCSFYHSNTTLPGAEFQPIHIDMPSLLFPGFPVALPPWLMVVNFPLIDFTVENGATEIWPGTHLNPDERDLAERCKAIPSIRATACAGDLIVRDLRTWHRGAPNHTQRTRTMLALVYNRPWFNMPPPPIAIRRSVWDELPEYAQRIFRENEVVGQGGE